MSSKLAVQGLKFGKREKKFYRKTKFLGTLKILQEIVFLRKNLWELLDARVLYIFEISAKERAGSQGVYYWSNALAWIYHFISVMKVGCISLVIYRTSSSWNCLKLGAKQRLPGQAVRSVNHTTTHTCQPTSSSSPCILLIRNMYFCLIKIEILLFTI